jgi:hypothetical protein
MSLLLNVSGEKLKPDPALLGSYDPVRQLWSTLVDVDSVEQAIPLLMSGSKTKSGGVEDDTST